MMTPQNLGPLIVELRRDEGVRYVEYLDTMGIPSTGVGHNLRVAPLPAGWTYPLSDAQVNQLLTQDIGNTLAQIGASLPWWSTLDDVRARVIANMGFNLGVGGLLTFRNMLLMLRQGDYAAAASRMRASRWFVQVGDRAKRLAQAMETGVMPTQ